MIRGKQHSQVLPTITEAHNRSKTPTFGALTSRTTASIKTDVCVKYALDYRNSIDATLVFFIHTWYIGKTIFPPYGPTITGHRDSRSDTLSPCLPSPSCFRQLGLTPGEHSSDSKQAKQARYLPTPRDSCHIRTKKKKYKKIKMMNSWRIRAQK